jgi:uncharacterized protein
MQGSFLRFYVHQNLKHHHGVVWEWLLMQANKMGIRGGSAFRAMAGFGRHHKLTETHLFDTSAQVMEVEFVVTDDEAQQLLDLLYREKIELFYAYIPARFGIVDRNTPPPKAVGE